MARAGKHKPQTWSRLSRSAHAHARGVHARVVACRDVADVPGPFFWCVWSARVLARSTSMAGGAYVQRPELRMSTIEPTLATTRQPTRCLHVFSRTPVARLPHTDFACAWLHEACVLTCRTSATVLRQPLVRQRPNPWAMRLRPRSSMKPFRGPPWGQPCMYGEAREPEPAPWIVEFKNMQDRLGLRVQGGTAALVSRDARSVLRLRARFLRSGPC